MSAFPPHKSIPSIPVPQDIALKYLSSYLEATKHSPHLIPNARLEPSGVSAGSSSSSVTLHNLQRVEAGLRGEWLAPQLDLGEGNVKVANGLDDGTNKEYEEQEGWVDLDQYQREQSIEGPEQALGETKAEDLENVNYGSNADTEEDLADVNASVAKKIKKSEDKMIKKSKERAIDKEARKREKKERRKTEQRKKAGTAKTS